MIDNDVRTYLHVSYMPLNYEIQLQQCTAQDHWVD